MKTSRRNVLTASLAGLLAWATGRARAASPRDGEPVGPRAPTVPEAWKSGVVDPRSPQPRPLPDKTAKAEPLSQGVLLHMPASETQPWEGRSREMHLLFNMPITDETWSALVLAVTLATQRGDPCVTTMHLLDGIMQQACKVTEAANSHRTAQEVRSDRDAWLYQIQQWRQEEDRRARGPEMLVRYSLHGTLYNVQRYKAVHGIAAWRHIGSVEEVAKDQWRIYPVNRWRHNPRYPSRDEAARALCEIDDQR